MKNTASKTQAPRYGLPTRIVALITALSLVFLQVPITGYSGKAMADATEAAQVQLAANTAIDVPLAFEHAYITYADQDIVPPATKVTIPGGAAMEFTAKADGGYQLESVKAVIDGTEVELVADEHGVYKLTAAEVATTSNITVRAITAPTVESVGVVEEEQADAAQAEADSADEGVAEEEVAVAESGEGADGEEAVEGAEAADAADADEAAAEQAAAAPKRAARSARLAAAQPSGSSTGVWDLADDSTTMWLHVSTDQSVTENEQQRDASFQLTFSYQLTEDVVRAMDAYEGNPTLVYDLSEMIANAPVKDTVKGSGAITIGTRQLGTYTIENNKVIITFTDQAYLDGRTELEGWFKLTMETDETKLGSDEEHTYTFPGTTDVIPIHYVKNVSNGSKWVDSTADADGNYTLSYTANVTVNREVDSLRFIDTLGGMQSLDASSVKLNGNPVRVSTTASGFEFDVAGALGTGTVAAGTYTVTYNAKVSAAQLKEMEASKDTETNTASWKVNGDKDVPGGETKTDLYKPHETVPVTKTIADGATARQPGDTITYEIVYGTSETKLAGLRISDSMTDVQTLQGDISISYGSTTTTMPAASIAADDGKYGKNMVTLFDYTFPSNTEGTGPVTVRYTTKLIDAETAKANGVYGNTGVINTATEKRYNNSSTVQTTVGYEKEKVMDVTKTESSAKNADGNWEPGSEITYTLTIGDANTDMAGVNISDTMTDLQVLQGDVKIRVGNGGEQSLNSYAPGAVSYVDDGAYGTNDVTLFNFTMPANAGKGPVVITYTTKVISQEQATDSGIYGRVRVGNTGKGGNGSSGTSGTAVFGGYPIDKKATSGGEDVSDSSATVKPGDTVHYTLTFGNEKMNLAGAVVQDEMTDVQRVVSDVVVTKADGTSFVMPTASAQWASDGYAWGLFDDGKYSQYQTARVFSYKLPDDIGYGPITIEYDAQIIGEDDVKNSSFQGIVHATNTFSVNGVTAQTNPTIDLPSNYPHIPQVSKSFDRFDIENNKVYWNIVVEKQNSSAYPLENVVVRELYNEVHITEPSQGFNNDLRGHTPSGADFDMANAVVTTESGVVLTPGVDYLIDRNTDTFTFPKLNEKVTISVAYKSPAKILDGYYIVNNAALQSPWQVAEADATYSNPGVALVKDGSYDESSRIVEWVVRLNPTKTGFKDSNPISVLFEDAIPEGLTLLNYETESEDNPTVKVLSTDWNATYYRDASLDRDTGVFSAQVAPADWSGAYRAGLNYNEIRVSYKTRLSDEMWDALTSSATGSEEFENHVKVTAGDNESFETTGKVTVTSEEFITKTDSTKENGGVVVDDSGTETKAISYTVEINPHGYTLNPGKTLSVVDYIDTNMDLDTASVSIVKVNADGTESAQDGIEISYNDDSRLLSLSNIPDQTHFRLTYKCNARAQGQDTFKNTATLIGAGSHSATTVEEHKIQTSSAGVRVNSIEAFIHKIDENDIQKDLDGATFQLYECQLAIGDLTNHETYDQAYWDALLATMDAMWAGTAVDSGTVEQIMEQFKIVAYVPVGDPVTTKDNGFTQWNSLSEHKLYAWKEVSAPDGYTASDAYHYFVGYQHIDVNSDTLPQPMLSDAEQLNRKHAAWALDDATQLANGIRVASMANLTTWTATNIKDDRTSISATKVWEGDSDNLFETRPVEGIKLQLFQINADGTREPVGDPVAINAGDDGEWPSHLWPNLKTTDAQGNQLKYTVVESSVAGYTTTYSDDGEGVASGTITVTNKMIPKNTSITVKKEFGAEVSDDLIPDQVLVELMVIKTDRDGNASDPEPTGKIWALSAANNWQTEFSGLPTTDSEGNALTYTASEVDAGGFVVSYSDDQGGVVEADGDNPLVITNSLSKGALKVTKSVEGGIELTDAQKKAISFSVTDADGNQVASFTMADMDASLSKTIDDLAEGTYTVAETVDAANAPSGYTMSTDYSIANGEVTVVAGGTAELAITNTYEMKTTSVSGKKVWDDADDQDRLRPAKVVVNLLADGEQVDSIEVSADSADEDGAWAYEFTDLPKQKDGRDIVYTVAEEPVAEYTTSINGYTITNTHKPATTTYSAEKTWSDDENRDNMRPASITVQLYAGDQPYGSAVALSSENNWKVTWSDLPAKSAGADIVYSVKETSVPKGYEASYDTSAAGKTVITNTHAPETTSYTVVKDWIGNGAANGMQPQSVQVQLKAGDAAYGDPVTLPRDGSWSYTWTDLPKYDNGKEIEYSADEVAVPADFGKALSTNEGITALRNTYAPETTKLTVVKKWNDDDNKDNTRPATVKVRLLANGQPASIADVEAEVALSGANGWTYTWSSLPVNLNGAAASYSVEELAVDGYTSSGPVESAEGLVITNTLAPGETSVSGKKVWDDADNQDGQRPSSVTVHLLADGTEVDSTTVTGDAKAGEWSYSFTGLPKYKDGKEIAYTVTEDAVDGYTTSVDGFAITNTHEPIYIDVSGTKTWNDEGDQDGLRPANIVVNLLADGTKVASQDVRPDADGNWTYTFKGQPKYANGTEIVYTVTEEPLAGKAAGEYEVAYNGTNITNTHEPAQISVSGKKVWDDADNVDGVRPGSITVNLLADDVKVDSIEVTGSTVDEDGNWTYEFTGLQKYRTGKVGEEIVYTVTEETVAGYDVSVNGTTITNTHTPETISISGEKTWADADNQDGLRPGSVTVRLLADGAEVATKSVTAKDGWQYSFTDLPKFKDQGAEITYTISEDAVPGYTSEVVGYNVTNTHEHETVDVSGTKTWHDNDNAEGGRPASITVRLFAGDEEVDSKVVSGEGGEWGYSFTGLDKYDSNGNEIVYSVVEDAVVNYTTVVSGYDIDNTYAPEKTSVSGTKTWVDADNQDGLRPADGITVRLWAGGVEVDSKVVKGNGNEWEYSFTDLNRYDANGDEIVYTVTEDDVAGYVSTQSGYNFTNTHTPATTERVVKKLWNDADNQDGLRSGTVSVQLKADGAAYGQPVVLSDFSKDWSYTWSDLPKFKDQGTEIVYTVEETVDLDGYTERVDTIAGGIAITNTHEPATISIAGTKTWDDADNQDGLRPEKITVSLLADGDVVKTVEVSGDGNEWSYSFGDMPKFKNGHKIVYTVTEGEVEGYSASIDGFNVKNTHTPETTSVKVTKLWDDAYDGVENYDHLRPASVNVRLYADDEPTDQVATLSGGSWAHVFTNLPKYKGQGVEIAYTVQEEGAVAGYAIGEALPAADVEGADAGYTITNTHTVEKTSVSGTKTWADNGDQDAKRPASITVNLLANDEVVDSIEVSGEGDEWSYAFDNLDKYDQDGKLITYTVTEDAVEGYRGSVDETGLNFTNEYTPESTSVKVTKVWDDADDQDALRPDAIGVTLQASVESGNPVTLPQGATGAVELPLADGSLSYTWTDLPVYQGGELITYTVVEDAVDDYQATLTRTTDYDFTLTNTHKPATVDLSVDKRWVDAKAGVEGSDNFDGLRPDSVTVRLLAGGEPVIIEGAEATAVLSDNNGWHAEWKDLPEKANGQAIAYTLVEDAVANYSTSITREGNAFVVTNTHEVVPVEVSGTKTWDDADDQDGLRPESITVRLLANGTEVATATAEAPAWTYSFGDLPRYANGKEIVYTVEEEALTGAAAGEYEVSYNGYDIVNAHTPETVSVEGTKTWDDNDDQDGLRPASITVNLLAGGAVIDSTTVSPDERGVWAYSFAGLPKYAAGTEIAYSVEEVLAGATDEETQALNDAYAATYPAGGYDIVNAHTPETVSVEGAKIWDDEGNQDGKRPASITVNLLAGGEVVDTATVGPGDWSYSFTDLPRYKAGVEISYSVAEAAVGDYSTEINGYDITNSYTPGKVSVNGTKTWEDNNDQDGLRPGSITVSLKADGEVVRTATVTPDERGVWSYGFADLDEYKDGVKIGYTVEETPVAGYEATVSGFNIVNAHTPETVVVSGTKTWDDADDQDGLRPESITVRLLANGTEVATATAEAPAWTYSFGEQPKYDGGDEIVYTVAENAVEGYTAKVSGYDVTNTHTPETIAVSGTKTWEDNSDQDGLRPASITVNLLADGAVVDSRTVTAADEWSYSFADLPKYAAGEEISYSVEEVLAGASDEETQALNDAYAATYPEGGYDIVNAHTPETVSIEGAKTWDDNGNQDGLRPASITVRLLADGTEIASRTVGAADGWKWSFGAQPKYRDKGTEIEYAVIEDAVSGYTPTVTGFDITNTHTPGKTSVSGSKTWNDEGDKDGLRPESITVNLLANGEKVASQVVTADDKWAYSFTGLDEYANGEPISYTVTEDAVPNYTTAIDGATITNSHTPEKTSVTVSKSWSDDNDRDGVRPASVLLTLYANGEAVSTYEMTEADNWTHTFSGLDKHYNKGENVVYTVGETIVPAGYSAEVSEDGLTMVNAHDNATVDVRGAKTWVDGDDRDGDRPASITVNLLADGNKIASQEVTSANGWAYEFTDLNKYRGAGAEIVYTVTEEPVEHYETSIEGYDITNTHIGTATVELKALKKLQSAGRALKADEFSFEVLEGDQVILTAANGADGYVHFEPITYTAADAGEHAYIIREVQGDRGGVTYDKTEHAFTVTVTDNHDGTIDVEYGGYDPEAGVTFTNVFTPSGSVALVAHKTLVGKDLEAGAYEFQITDGQDRVYAVATNDADGNIAFPALNFSAAGTYVYTISEVLPDGAQRLGTGMVADGVSYDLHSVEVRIAAVENEDGTLSFTTTYEGDGAEFENAAVPDTAYPLAATKAITGRDFTAGDEFTFTVTADDANAPLPENPTVTITPASGSEAAISFGNITFTTDDLGKSYTYTVTEQGAGQTVDGVLYDPFSHWVRLTVVDAGDGTLGVTAEYQNDAEGMTFTNAYGATGQISLGAVKVLTGRALAGGEFFFELSGGDLPAPLHASAAADGTVTFPELAFTQEDVGRELHYTISEVQGALGGVTYDRNSYDVTVTVADNGDGTLTVSADYGEGVATPVFYNTYRAAGTSVELTAHKALVGRALAGGEFTFELEGASENAAGTQMTAVNDADGLVAFDAIDYDAAGVYSYRITETIPADAVDNGDGTFTGADGIVYDGSEHTATVTVADDGNGKLVATVDYDDGATGVSFGNTALTRTGFTFDKYFFGGVGTFDFKLTAVDADGEPRTGAAADYSDAATILDDGAQAFTATVQNGAYAGNVAQVVFPEIAYAADGDYFYLVEEAESSTPGMVADAAQYLVHVTVAGGAVADTEYELIYDGVNYGPTDDLSFYNNSAVTLGFSSLSTQGYTSEAQRTSVYPKAQKYLNDSVDMLVGDDFAFELVDEATGAVLAVATNDQAGNIAFFDEDTDPGLVFDEPGTYRYILREVNGGEAGMIYDDSEVTLTVTVEQGDEGLVATTAYNGPGGAEPAFYNVREGIDVVVQKVSRYGGEGLVDCTYALWMVGENGDVMIQEATSDANGYIEFKNVNLIAGQKYYFKEVEAPIGHTVDPYRTAYLALNEEGTQLVVIEETAADGWHSAIENIELDRAKQSEASE